MTLSYGPKLGLLENAATGEVHDNAFRKFLRGMDGMTQLSVKDKDISTPPGSPLNGDCYLVAPSPTPTGAWAGGANKIARYSSHAAAWELWTPFEGWVCWVQDEDTEYRYNGTAWGLNAWSGSSIQFSTTSSAPAHNPGLVYWDKDLKCMAYHAAVAGVSNQVGEELWVRAYNATGSLIQNGSVVYISGAQAGLPTMALADASTLTKCGAVGMVTHDVANASEGFVTRFGMVRGLNTNGLTDGAPVYLSATTPGAWTVTPPTTGYLLVVGAIAQAAPSGTIYTRPHPPLAIDTALGSPGSNLVAPTQLAVKTALANIEHNNTTNKQGGTTGEYYHLTSAQNSQVALLNGTAAKTLSWQNTLTLVGTDGTTLTFPATNATMARTDAAQTFSGMQTFSNRVLIDDATEATTDNDGSLRTIGGLSVAKNAVIGGTLNSGPASITGTTATDGPTYGAELLSGSGWTSTGWTGDFATGFTHTTGNATSLTNTLAAVIGNKYQMSYTITGRTAGSVTIAFGGQSIAGITATGAFGPTATTVDGLSITPTTDFNGKIVISIKQITSGSSAIYTVKDSAGNTKSEIRTIPGVNNTANGYQALYYNTSGYKNTANGYQGLYSNTTGYNNTANGYQVLYSNTTGYNNTANGYQVLYSNTTGYKNTANGYQVLYYNTTGYNNTANGSEALHYNTTGSNNTANGSEALHYNTTGYNNTASGYQALYSNTTGYVNTANGFAAGSDNTTGYQNTYLGYNTGRGITTGINNTVLGASVGGLAAGLSDNIILATGQGTIRMQFDGAKWKLNLANVPAYANNAAAIAGGLAAGNIYRTNGDPDALCIVH